MKYYDVDKQKVLESLETSEDGLSSDEAKARLTRYGANKLKETNKKLTQQEEIELWLNS